MTPPAELIARIPTNIWASLTSIEEYIKTFATCSVASKQWDAIITEVNSMHSLIPSSYSGGQSYTIKVNYVFLPQLGLATTGCEPSVAANRRIRIVRFVTFLKPRNSMAHSATFIHLYVTFNDGPSPSGWSALTSTTNLKAKSFGMHTLGVRMHHHIQPNTRRYTASSWMFLPSLHRHWFRTAERGMSSGRESLILMESFSLIWYNRSYILTHEFFYAAKGYGDYPFTGESLHGDPHALPDGSMCRRGRDQLTGGSLKYTRQPRRPILHFINFQTYVRLGGNRVE
ncbi:hypothetical protein IW261DRAFT_1421426 [Armillaria novae-zelandiae]|uniref:Uncharacterized protein n=1 Tax=Armillaria novae-zelandiae TaxID=153914 RepID=A0AA39P3M4_9AGAR|nr:hypothetical protein IW261DRAFT_1421426 [Armillaria novae-zelandiae]